MGTIPTKTSRWRKFFGWFGRHKVLAVFCVLLLALALCLAVLQVVWEVQVHFERERFEKAAQEISQIQRTLPQDGVQKALYTKGCRHSNFGAIFETDTISCDAEVEAIYSAAQERDAQNLAQKTKLIMVQRGLDLKGNLHNNDPLDIASYDFKYKNLGCLLDISYYDEQTPPTERDHAVPDNGSVALVDISCGGRAKLDYFPVID